MLAAAAHAGTERKVFHGCVRPACRAPALGSRVPALQDETGAAR
jgi:hypothetical protein